MGRTGNREGNNDVLFTQDWVRELAANFLDGRGPAIRL
jgi:hypothetical protein